MSSRPASAVAGSYVGPSGENPRAPGVPTPTGPAASTVVAKPFAFLRTSGYFSGPKLRDSALDNLLGTAGVRIVATPWISWTVSAVSEASSFDRAQLRALDAVANVKLVDALQFWAGRFVVPFDRFNLAGPYRTLIWTYPGFYGDAKITGAESGPYGRSTGAAVWGSVCSGTFKYYAAAHELDAKDSQPRVSGRLAVTLLDGEPEYFVGSTYLGSRDVIALGAAAQYQPEGRVSTDTNGVVTSKAELWALTGDLFVEKTWNGVGTFTLDGAYHHYDPRRLYDWGYFATLAYALPLQWFNGVPQVGMRWQAAHGNDDILTSEGLPLAADVHGVDVTLSHTIPSSGVKFAIDYSRQQLNSTSRATRVYVGAQYAWP